MHTLLILLPLLYQAQASDNNFCGSTWQDASTSCEERQHCPNGSDEECTIVPGSICFADTLCDASKGHGAKAVVAGLAYLIDIPHEDATNHYFCGSWWATAQENCGLDTFCGTNREGCKDFDTCFETQCHVQDIVAAEMGEDWKDMITGGGREDGKPIKLDEKDARRNNFCGTTWADAASRCGQWCLGEDTDCPGNQKCFGDTGCYYDEDLKPTLSPTSSPPTSEAPILSNDPINNQFCGETWAKAIEHCTPDTNCRNNEDCPETEVCHGFLPGCVLSEMLVKGEEIIGEEIIKEEGEEIYLRPNDPTNHFFCGESWLDSVENCSLETHCPDNDCPEGKSCFQFIEYEGCDAYEIWVNITPEPTHAPTLMSKSPATDDPTERPTKEPIVEPTKAPVIIVHGLCAKDEEHLQQIYRTTEECSNVDPCPDDLTCIQSFDFEAVADKKPSKKPSRMPSQKPTKEATPVPTAPSRKFFTQSPTLGLEEKEEETLPPYMPSAESTVASSALVEQPETFTMQPYVMDSEMPTYAGSTDIKNLRFYCAVSVGELRESCDGAIECTNGEKCPEGQGCIHYDCEKNNDEQDDYDSGGYNFDNNFVPECPDGLVGYTSSSPCKIFYKCNDGEIGRAEICDDGLKYDTIRNMCWYEDEVDTSTCRGPPEDTPEPTLRPSQWPTHDTSNLVCPQNIVGATSISTSESNCKLFYECRNGAVGSISTCEGDFKYDIVRQMCWYKDEVNDRCYGPPIGQSPHESGSQDEQNSDDKHPYFNAENPTANNQSYTCPERHTGWATHDGCKQYYWCQDGIMERDILYCIEGLLFDAANGICKHACEVHCNETYTIQNNETSLVVSTESVATFANVENNYAWPETDTTTTVNEDRGSEMGEWYSRTQVNLNSRGTCLMMTAVWVITQFIATYIISVII